MSHNKCLPTHLDSPLCYEKLDKVLAGNYFQTSLSYLRKEALSLQTLTGVDLKKCKKHPQIELPNLMTIALQSKSSIECSKSFQNHLLNASFLLQCNKNKDEVLSKSSFDEKTLTQSVSQHPWFPDLIKLYNMRSFLEQGVCLTAKPLSISREADLKEWIKWTESNVQNAYAGSFSPNFKVVLCSNISILEINDDLYIGTRDHFLLLCDVFSQRFLCLLSCILAEIFKYNNYPSCNLLLDTFSWGDSLLRDFGNQSFSSISIWESLTVGWILSQSTDEICDSNIFLSTMKQEFLKSQGPDNTPLLLRSYIFFENLMKRCQNLDQVTQLFGLYRIWGHPSLNLKEGINKLKSVACKPKMVNYSIIKVIHLKWREYFCLNYYKKNRAWPEFQIIKHPKMPSYILDHLQNSLEINKDHPQYRLADWNFIKFSETFSIPENFDLSEMISDKATSHGVKDLKNYIEQYGNIGPSHTRSVIIQWLSTNYNNPAEFLHQIDKEGFGPDEIVVGVHPKERELKLAARFFGLLTIKKRLYVVVTEALLASFIFEYFPEITMTFDFTTLMTRIHHNTKKLDKQEDNRKTVVINMDFNKWNSNMRYEETEDIFRDFDNLFGLNNCFLRTHSMFSESTLYLADNSFLPSFSGNILKESDYSWTGHLGGIEGLRQKGWTIFTVVILKYIADDLFIDCQIMGQGDNQVLLCTYHKEEISFAEQHMRFLSNLNSFLSLIGPPLKLEETWSSSCFFIYGKYPVYKGAPLSMSLKKLCRTMRLTNEGLQNLESTLSSIAANACAATQSDFNPHISYLISMFESSGALELHLKHPFYHHESIIPQHNRFSVRVPHQGQSVNHRFFVNPNIYSELEKGRKNIMRMLLLTPCCLGGYPILQYYDLLIHGFPDPVSIALWGVKQTLISLDPNQSFLRFVLTNLLNPIINPEISPDMLCANPTSLNMFKCSTGSDKVKNMVFTFLKNPSFEIKNKHFLSFLSIAEEGQKELSSLLFKMKPFHPRIAHSILESTIIGRAMKIVSKVNKTGTLINLMLKTKDLQSRNYSEEEFNDDLDYDWRRPKTFCQSFAEFELNYFHSCISATCESRPEDMSLSNCSTKRAQQLREKSWAITIEGVTVAVPMELIQISSSTDCSDEHPNPSGGYFLLRSSQLLNHISFTRQLLGPFKPFFGSKTKCKVKYDGGIKRSQAPPMLQNALTLLSLPGWGTKKDSKFSSLLYKIVNSFTDLDPLSLVPDYDRIGGTLDHRWQDTSTSHESSISILWNYATHLNISSNTFTPESLNEMTTTDNFNIIFQSIFSWISCMWSISLSQKHTVFDSYHAHISCSDCIIPINEEKLDLEISSLEELNLSVFKPKPENPYCWIDGSNLIKKSFSTSKLGSRTSIEGIHMNSQKLLLHMLTLSWVWKQIPSLYLVTDYFDFSAENLMVIPVSISMKLEVISFFKLFLLEKVIRLIFYDGPSRRMIKIYKDKRKNKVIIRLYQILENSNSSFFSVFSSLMLNNSLINDIINLNSSIPFPKGTPPSSSEINLFFKNIMLELILQETFFQDLLNMIDFILINPLPVLSNLSFHPYVLTYVKQLLSNTLVSEEIIDHIDLLIKFKYLNSPTSETDLLSEFFNNQSIPGKIQSQILSLHHHCDWVINNYQLVYCDVDMDSVAKILGPRVRPNHGIVDNPYVQKPKSFKRLSGSMNASMIFSFDQLHKGANLTLSSGFVTLPLKSLYNHINKVNTIYTTAPYKLLSIIHYIQDKYPQLLRENLSQQYCCCLADGVGGFTYTCGKVFGLSPLFYNSLFKYDKLNSVGINKFIPANIACSPDILSRTSGYDIMEERVSDLTDIQTQTLLISQIQRSFLITCDAEIPQDQFVSKSLALAKGIAYIGFKTQAPIIIFKTYGSSPGLLFSQCIIFKSYYNSVEVIRSNYSSLGASELYLVITDKRIDPTNLSYKVQHNQITIHGSNIAFIDWSNLNNSLIKSTYWDRTSHCNNNYDSILDSNTRHSITNSWKGKLRIIAESINWISARAMPQPFSSLTYFRKKFNLVKFSDRHRASLKLNLITQSVFIEIAKELVTLFCIFYNKEKDLNEFMDWEQKVATWYITLYLTIKDEWSVQLHKDFYWTTTLTRSTSRKISEILNPGVIKKIIVTCGQYYKWFDGIPELSYYFPVTVQEDFWPGFSMKYKYNNHPVLKN